MHAPLNTDALWLDTSLFARFPMGQIEKRGLASRPNMRIIETTKANVRVRAEFVKGRPAVIVLPDGPNIIEHHDPIFDELRGDLSVIGIEIPGLGFSFAKQPEALSFTGTLDALENVINQLDAGPLIITGSCSQAYVAIALAARFAVRTLGVIASQATDLASEKMYVAAAVDPLGFLRTPMIGQMAWAKPANRERLSIDGWYRLAAGPSANVEAWQEIARWSLGCGSCFALGSMLQSWFGEEDIPIPVWHGPAAILFGCSDKTHLAHGSDRKGLIQYIPQAIVHMLEDVGHFPELEARAEYVRTIRNIADSNPLRTL